MVDGNPSDDLPAAAITGLLMGHGHVWLGNAQDLIKQGIADLSTVIGCRDDIMVCSCTRAWILDGLHDYGGTCGRASVKDF